MAGRSRSRSKGPVDRVQRCCMLRRFHADLQRREPRPDNLLACFTDDVLAQLTVVVGDRDWETVNEGEDRFDSNWNKARSLVSQLAHARKWYLEAKGEETQADDCEGTTETGPNATNVGNHAVALDGDALGNGVDVPRGLQITKVPGAAGRNAVAKRSNTEQRPTAVNGPEARPPVMVSPRTPPPLDVEAMQRDIQERLNRVRPQYRQIPPGYLAVLAAKKEASLCYRACEAAADLATAAGRRAEAAKDALRQAQDVLTNARRAVRDDAEFEAAFAELELGRRLAKGDRNAAHDTWAGLVRDHHDTYGKYLAARERFVEAEAKEVDVTRAWDDFRSNQTRQGPQTGREREGGL